MSWRDNLRKASFRGVPFYVEATNTGIGRRNTVHVYPKKDTPYVEDMGKIPSRFSITGHLVQNAANNYDYFPERDQLIKALVDSDEPGKLVHPFYGERQVYPVGEVQINETIDSNGGIASFSMTFLLAGENKFPGGSTDWPTKLETNRTDYTSAVQDLLDLEYTNSLISGGGVIDFLQDQSTNIVTEGLRGIKRIIRTIPYPITSIEAVSDVLALVDDAISTVGTVIDTAEDVYSLVAGTVEDVQNIVSSTDPRAAVRAMLQVARFGEEVGSSVTSLFYSPLVPVALNTTIRKQERKNQRGLTRLFRAVALDQAVAVATTIEYDSKNQAIALRDELIDSIDNELDTIAAIPNDEVFQQLSDLRAELVSFYAATSGDLAEIVEVVTSPAPQPDLFLAYDRYEDLSRASEIYQLNRAKGVKHPGFLPSGRAIEVLNA